MRALSDITELAGRAVVVDKYSLGLKKAAIEANRVATRVKPRINFHLLEKMLSRSGMGSRVVF